MFSLFIFCTILKYCSFQVDDRGLYAPGQFWLTRKDVVGRAKGFVPYIGMVTILMNDYPKLKYSVLAILGLFVLIHRE